MPRPLLRSVAHPFSQAGERLPCTASEEGTLSSWFVASAPAGVDKSRVKFLQGNACALPPAGAASADGSTFGPFHAVLASNLLCRCAFVVAPCCAAALPD